MTAAFLVPFCILIATAALTLAVYLMARGADGSACRPARRRL